MALRETGERDVKGMALRETRKRNVRIKDQISDPQIRDQRFSKIAVFKSTGRVEASECKRCSVLYAVDPAPITIGSEVRILLPLTAG